MSPAEPRTPATVPVARGNTGPPATRATGHPGATAAPGGHRVRLSELPVVAVAGAMRVELECPSGCLRGYLWAASAEHADEVRRAAQAAAKAHSGRRVKGGKS